jgi:aquaporin related protein
MDVDEPKSGKSLGRLFKKIPLGIRGHIVAVIGEFVGTFSFLFFAFTGAQTANVASNPNTGDTVITGTAQKTPQQLLYISLAFGFSLAVNAWVFFRVSGGLFNPAVSVDY